MRRAAVLLALAVVALAGCASSPPDACAVAYRATVDRLEGPDVALEDASVDAYEIPECTTTEENAP